MAEQLWIDQRCRQRMVAGESNPPAALRIETYDTDGESMSEGKRKRAAIAPRGLEDHLNIRP